MADAREGAAVVDVARNEHWRARDAFLRGLIILFRAPAIVLFAGSMGYGALAHHTGLDLGLTLFINATFFALPAQVVLVDHLARDAALWGAFFAVVLTAVRLLPMTVSLMPLLRNGSRLPRFGFLATHFVAISVWVDGNERLPYVPPRLRMTYFLGMGSGMLVATLSGSAVGYFLAGNVPVLIGGMLLFISPAFFLLSQIGTAHRASDWTALGLGALFGPLLFYLVPGADLLLAGLIGGTVAFIVHRRGNGRNG